MIRRLSLLFGTRRARLDSARWRRWRRQMRLAFMLEARLDLYGYRGAFDEALEFVASG